MMTHLVEWLTHTRISTTISDTAWIIPAVQCVHILAIAFTFTSMAMLDLRLAGVAGRQHSIESLAKRFLPTMWLAVIVLLVTGILLILGEPSRALLNWVFGVKMLLLLAVLLLTLVSDRVLRGYSGTWDRTTRPPVGARVVGILSLLLWTSIIVAGRWIAYSG